MDSLIEAKQGANAPPYRGLCYIVFERLPLAPFGNRIPNIAVELCRVVGELEPAITAVTVIPGATEFGYDPEPRLRLLGNGRTAAENTHLSRDVSDWTLSLDELTALCPNLEHVSLVVAWFGDDLRCAHCTIEPKVEATVREVEGTAWEVAGISRGAASVVSSHGGGPAYGGTPSDAAVRAAIEDLQARGIGVTLYPMLLMDIPEGSGLGQPAYPWRGRIACSTGAVGTGAAATEVAAFTSQYRDFVLYYAHLADAVGGVDAFIIGSELRGMTGVRGAANSFPFVSALVDLAHDVAAVLPHAKLTYAADWSEYSGVQSGSEKFFHLDPLWASNDIDAVGIDNYMPLADWRSSGGPDAADWDGPYDPAYLQRNIAGGEGFDWYYASDADRLAGTRTPITDGAGEPWVWRFKDLVSWWSNAHHDRPGGVRAAGTTAWTSRRKPIWFTELGCGAVDKGANQPNVFSDPKSSESGKPYFSSGVPDALAQRQFLRATLDYWAANNPSDGHGGHMLERTYLWTWDARPYPAFPNRRSVWSDGANHATGHWLSGRLGGLASDELVQAIAADFGVELTAEAALPFMHGYVVDAPMTARAALEPVLSATGLEARDTPEGLSVGRVSARAPAIIDEIVAEDGPLLSRRRPDPGERVGQVALIYADRQRNYLAGSVTAIAPANGPLASVAPGLVLDLGGARTTAERLLLERTIETDTLEFTLPPSLAALEVGDAVGIDGGAFAITAIREGLARRISARGIAPELSFVGVVEREAPGDDDAPVVRSVPVLAFAELPPATDDVSRARLAVGAFADPWPGSVSVTDAATGATVATLAQAATMGELTAPLAAGGIFTWDESNAIELTLYSGHLSSRDEDEVLAGANCLAVETDAGGWEVVGFAQAELTGPASYRLTRLLRGQWGTDATIGPCSAGNRVLLLDGPTTVLPVPGAWLGAEVALRSFAGPADAAGQVAEVTIGLDPVLPLAPVHVAAVREAGGDITLSWVRRSRADTDSWAPDDAPLDAAPEGYRVTIYNAGVPVRVSEAGSPALTYTAAQQTADFGAPPASFDFTVAQISPLYGPGHAAAGIFTA